MWIAVFTSTTLQNDTNKSQVLGFKLKQNGKLDSRAAWFRVRSDWLDLKDLCHRTGLQLSWLGPDGPVVALKDNIITDPLVSTLVILNRDNTSNQLQIKHARASILHLRHKTNSTGRASDCKENSHYSSLQTTLYLILSWQTPQSQMTSDMIKARSQCFPTRYNLAIWYPSRVRTLLHTTPYLTGKWNSCTHTKRMLQL